MEWGRKGEFEEANKLIAEAEVELNNLHKFQTELIQTEANGKGVTPNILLILK